MNYLLAFRCDPSHCFGRFSTRLLRVSTTLPSFTRYRARTRKRRETWRGYTFLQIFFWVFKKSLLRLLFKYFISQRRTKHNLSNSNSEEKGWTDDWSFSPHKRRGIDFIPRPLALETTLLLDIVQDSTARLFKCKTFFPPVSCTIQILGECNSFISTFLSTWQLFNRYRPLFSSSFFLIAKASEEHQAASWVS